MIDLVHHYTTMDSFLRLLESIKVISDKRCFMFGATNIFFLNDPQEFIYGQDVLLDILRDIESNKHIDDNLCLSTIFRRHKEKSEKEWLKELRNAIHDQNESPYVICFSRNEDSLPMWLNYGDGGKGLCLSFIEYQGKITTESTDPKDLIGTKVEIYDQLGTHDVNYDLESIKDKDNLLRRLIEDLYDYYLNNAKKIKSDKLQDLQIGCIRGFTEVTAPYIKTKDYEGEREVRFAKTIKDGIDGKNRDIHFRCNSKGHIIPFIEIEIPTSQLKHVKIGPLANRELSFRAIDMLRKKYGLDFGILQSDVNYRDY